MKKVNLTRKEYGSGQRLSYFEKETERAPVIPQPVEYADIDKSVLDFFDNELELVSEKGEKFPIFTLFSNQRFSEYSQTWQHTDNDGNLLMNFKTINRENNPSYGSIHGHVSNIPGNNRFALCIREILDQNGVECYEVTSMSQPIAVDIMYRINVVTAKYEVLNAFNTRLNQLFACKQCYVRPNGHYMPMVLDQINDETDYSIEERKFYSQSAIIKLMGYLIPKDDIKVRLVPKRRSLSINNERFLKTRVSVEDGDGYTDLKIDFKPGVTRVSFEYDDEDVFNDEYEKINIRSYEIYVNDEKTDGLPLILKCINDAKVKINIIPINPKKPSCLILRSSDK